MIYLLLFLLLMTLHNMIIFPTFAHALIGPQLKWLCLMHGSAHHFTVLLLLLTHFGFLQIL